MGAALNILALVYSNAHPGSKLSWRKLNPTLSEALSLVIKAEVVFEPDEVQEIYNQLKGNFWFGSTSEWILRTACVYGNASAAASYNRWRGRQRFPFKGRIYIRRPALVDADHPIELSDHLDKVAYGRSEPALDLLFEGATFDWKGELVTVTSFSNDGKSLTACSYKDSKGTKVASRYTIAAAELRELARPPRPPLPTDPEAAVEEIFNRVHEDRAAEKDEEKT